VVSDNEHEREIALQLASFCFRSSMKAKLRDMIESPQGMEVFIHYEMYQTAQ